MKYKRGDIILHLNTFCYFISYVSIIHDTNRQLLVELINLTGAPINPLTFKVKYKSKYTNTYWILPISADCTKVNFNNVDYELLEGLKSKDMDSVKFFAEIIKQQYNILEDVII